MAVAETSETELITRNPQQQLAVGSAIGAIAVLAGLWFVLAGLPEIWGRLWDQRFESNRELRENVFLSGALLIILDLIAAVGLLFVGYRVLQGQTQPGLRAGIFFLAIYLFIALWFIFWLGRQLQDQFPEPAVGVSVMVVVFGALLAGGASVYMAFPRWMGVLDRLEPQGWFHGYTYKGNQGVRVRRGTIVGILLIGMFGIVTLWLHHWFGADKEGVPNNWTWETPYSSTYGYVPLMYKVHVVMPI